MLDEVTNLQNAGARVTMLGDVNDPIYAYFNPSIAYDGKGKLRINVRACNFAVKPHGDWYIRGKVRHAQTKNLYGYLNPDTLEITGLKEVKHDDKTPEDIAKISGLEDARIFWREDGMHFSGVRVDTRIEYRTPGRQAELLYDEKTNTLKYLRTMYSPSLIRTEKNWMPTDKPADFEYSYSPTQVYKNNSVQGEIYEGFIRGGSQLLWQPNTKTWLCIMHSKHADRMQVGKVYDKQIYVHYFAEYSEDGILQRLSEPFTFGLQDYIEFAAGMVEHKDSLLISLGAGDARMGFARISKQTALDMLTKYTGIEVSPLPPLTRAHIRYIDIATYELGRQR